MGPITNVAHSWIEAFEKELGFSFNIFCPDAWFEKYREKMKAYDVSTDLDHIVHHCINDQILSQADVVMTDTWKSMGEDIKIQDYDLIKEFRVSEKVMKMAKSDSIFMHCLPANRNEEVEASIIDGKNSRVWQEASNRLFVQKEILKLIF